MKNRRRPSVTNIIAVLLSLWVGATCFSGCATTPAVQPVQAFEAKPLEPEAWYRLLHLEVESCLGRQRPYEDVRWFVVRPGVMDMPGENATAEGMLAGRWSWPNKIFLDARYVFHEAVIRHELAHYILGVTGFDQHSDPKFIECTGSIS